MLTCYNSFITDDAPARGRRQSRKRLRQPSLWERNVRKKKKARGEEHVSTTGKLNKAQPMRSPCRESCRRRCYEKFKEEDRRMLYQDYRNATPEEQNQILCGLIIEENKKSQRLRGREGESRRRFSRHYFLKEVIPEKEVCQKMFLSTFGITLKRARIITEKMRQSGSGIVAPDGRGKHGKQKKISPISLEMIKKHINQFPAWKSHYARADSERKYLNPDLTIAQMYRLYQKYCHENNLPPEKESMYRKIFNEEFNLSFHHPSQDTCEKCDTFKASLMTASDDDKNRIEEEKAKHHELAEMAYNEKRADKEFALKSKGIVTASFDLQKVLPCPMLQTGIVYYKRQLAVYNLTIFETSVDGNKAHCMIWDETIAKRGGQEIGSCVMKWLNGLSDDIKDIRLYSDSCGGQNRNHLFAAMLMNVSRSKGIKITHSFLEPGHTHMEADTVHALIEKYRKSATNIEVPRDWSTTIRAIHRKNKLQVTEMQTEDFINFKSLYMSAGPLVNRHKDKNGQKVNWMKIKKMEYNQNEIGQIMCWTSFSQNAALQHLDLRRKEKGRPPIWILPQLEEGPRKIPPKKLKDLMDLLPLISAGSRHFYRSLQAAEDASDDVYLDDEPDL